VFQRTEHRDTEKQAPTLGEESWLPGGQGRLTRKEADWSGIVSRQRVIQRGGS
jgi:hypothetical protein